MASKSSSSSEEPTVETTDVEAPPEVETAVAGAAEEGDVTYQLPPALSEAGLVGIVGVVSGIHTMPTGLSYNFVPGTAFAVETGDATAAVDQGFAVMLNTYSTA
jgi:hypothetical protein